MNDELRRRLARRLSSARRRLAEADSLVEVGEVGGRRLWRSRLADSPIGELETEAVAAVGGYDPVAACVAVERLEAVALRAKLEASRDRQRGWS